MRLSVEHCARIKGLILEMLGSSAVVWLFGSRVDDEKRGGDLDLYVEVDKPIGLEKKLRLMTRIQRAVGVRKVDLVVHRYGSQHRSIALVAKKEGIRL